MSYVSVVIPAKNEEAIIGKVLSALKESMRQCDYPCEVILVDNGSQDFTCKIASEQGCTILVDSRASIAGLRNLGARESKGDIVAFLDADCIVDPKWIRFCVERLSDPNVGLVATRAVPDFCQSTWLEDGWYALISGVYIPDYPKWVGSSNMFLRREVFWEVGGFNEKLKTAEDVNLCQKIASKYKICLEQRITTIHLRESKTVVQMARREIWRGMTSIRQLLVSGDWRSEIASVAVPVFIVLLFLISFVGVCVNGYLKWSAVAVLFMPFAMMKYKKALIKSARDFRNVYFVGLIYLLSRAVSVLVEIDILVRSFITRATP